MEQDKATPKPTLGFKKNSQTRPKLVYLKLKLIPLGMGQGGYQKKPAPLSSLLRFSHQGGYDPFWT